LRRVAGIVCLDPRVDVLALNTNQCSGQKMILPLFSKDTNVFNSTRVGRELRKKNRVMKVSWNGL